MGLQIPTLFVKIKLGNLDEYTLDTIIYTLRRWNTVIVQLTCGFQFGIDCTEKKKSPYLASFQYQKAWRMRMPRSAQTYAHRDLPRRSCIDKYFKVFLFLFFNLSEVLVTLSDFILTATKWKLYPHLKRLSTHGEIHILLDWKYSPKSSGDFETNPKLFFFFPFFFLSISFIGILMFKSTVWDKW